MAGERKAISAKTRFEVFKRDRFTCQYCGAHPPAVVLHVDHIVPVAGGGSNTMDNYITSCAPCNLGKGARELTNAPKSLQDKAAEVSEREAQLAGWAEVMNAQRERIEADLWDVAEVLDPGCSEKGFSKAYLTSIKTFNERLGKFAVIDAAEIAFCKKPSGLNSRFRYFCGICWARVRDSEGASNA
jgi:hypothetical protein